MPLEDYTTYTEIDPNNRISETANNVTDYAIDNENASLYKDYGAAHFGDFTFYVDVKSDYNQSSSRTSICVLANSTENTYGIYQEKKVGIWIDIFNSGGKYLGISESVVSGSPLIYTAWALSGTANASQWYYLTLIKIGTSFTITVYQESARTTSLGTATITLHGTYYFRYILACDTWNTGNTYYQNLNVGHLDLTPLADITAPTYSNVAVNSTEIGAKVNFTCLWTDNVAVWKWIFGINQTGSWQNDSTVTLNNVTSAWANATQILNSTNNLVIGYEWWCCDNSSNWANTGILILSNTPIYSGLSVSSAQIGASCTFSCTWTENSTYKLGVWKHIFGTNNTGNWQNETTVDDGNATSVSATSVQTLNSTVNLIIGYEWWCEGNTSTFWANTGILTIMTIGYPIDNYTLSNQDVGDSLGVLHPSSSGVWDSDNGQSFTMPSATYNITNVQFYARKLGNPTGTVFAVLYSHSGIYGTTSRPTGSALATSDGIDVSSLSTSYQLINFTFNTTQQITMNASSYYCIDFQNPTSGTIDSSNYPIIGEDSSSPTASGNYFYYRESVWGYSSGVDTIFYVYGVPSGIAGPATYLVNLSYSVTTTYAWVLFINPFIASSIAITSSYSESLFPLLFLEQTYVTTFTLANLLNPFIFIAVESTATVSWLWSLWEPLNLALHQLASATFSFPSGAKSKMAEDLGAFVFVGFIAIVALLGFLLVYRRRR